MKNKHIISESKLNEIVYNVIKEALTEKTFMKIGKPQNNTQQSPMPMGNPTMDTSMGGNMPMDNENIPMGNNQMGNINSMGEFETDSNDMGDENQFDTNFDAGVEADEDSDPKHYIQQLTGKLSQKLNSFNTDEGGDEGINKYVLSMIITATCKNLDDKAKQEMISKIKSSSAESEEDIDFEDDDTDDENDETELENDEMMTKKELQESIFFRKLT